MNDPREIERAVLATGVTVVPDPRKRLSDGVFVNASVRARLLGIPLLRIEATIALAPAGLRATAPASGRRGLPIRGSSKSPPAASTHTGIPGRAVIDARRTIDEGAEFLAESRRNGS